jgi:hypothetical protein
MMIFQYAETGLSYICGHHDEISCKEKQIIIPLPALLSTNYYSSFDYRTYYTGYGTYSLLPTVCPLGSGTYQTSFKDPDLHHFGKLAPDPHQSGKGEA